MWKLVVLGICMVVVKAQDPPVCEYNGVTYKDGESFPDADNCNTCFCAGGHIACTMKFCLPAPTSTCTYGNDTYNPGDSFKDADGCNTCACQKNGMVICTEMACVDVQP